MLADSRVRQGIYGFPIVVFWRNTANDTISFLGKYNFNFPKRAPEPYGYSGNMESWEFQNNTSNLVLYKSDYFDETIKTDLDTGETKETWRFDYEARFPSSKWVNYEKLQELQSFIYSTYRANATNADLSSSVTYEEVTYTKDTADYRLAKFRNEFGNYAEVNSFIFYYIFTEFFLMVDSRAKNLFIGFSGSDTDPSLNLTIDRKAVAEPYDMDTAMGTNNEAKLVFGDRYSYEDTDYLSGGDKIFNGQDSVLWNNVRDAFPTEIANMYRTLRSTGGFNYNFIESRYEEHQSKWPEAIWLEDAWFKYIDPLIAPDSGKQPTGVYLPMLQGSKEQQRKWWLWNRFKYMDSKWNAGDALSEVITLRGYEKADITITPYTDIYPTIKYASYLVQARSSQGQPVTLACPVDEVNDTEIYIYSAPQIASVGDLSGLKVGFADFSMGTKLQSIKVGDSSASYNNSRLDELYLGTNTLLGTVDARNCSSLGTGNQKSVDLSHCSNIEYVYFDGTQIAGVNLPNGGILKVLQLPNTITNLTIRNQPLLTTLTVAGYSNISTLWLENVGNIINEKTILNTIPANARIRIIGFVWNVDNITEIDNLYDRLDMMRGLDEQGNNTTKAQVSGVIHIDTISGDQIEAYQARYPYISFDADHLRTTLTYMNYDGTSTISTVDCIDGVPQSSAPAGPSRASTAQYTYTFVGWSIAKDAQTATANYNQNVNTNKTVYAAYSRTTRTYTVTWKNSDGSTLETDTNVPYGTNPQYNGSTPVNPVSGGGAFTGWTPSLSAVTGDITYTASFIPVYTVEFRNDDNTLIKQESVQQGGSVTPPSNPTSVNNPTWTFDGWSNSYTNIQSNTVCVAQYLAPQVWFDEEITDSWDTIIANITSGNFSYQPGNYKPLDLGTEGIINMQIAGLNKDPLASGSGNAATTWIAKELLTTSHRMNPSRTANTVGTGSIGGWENTEMRTWLKETIKPLIPANVSNAIKSVTKYSRIYDATETVQNNVTSTDDVWIPSYREIFGGTSYEISGPVYDDGYKDANSRKKAKVGSSSTANWWLRSANDAYSFMCVDYNGSNSSGSASGSLGAALGFCI